MASAATTTAEIPEPAPTADARCDQAAVGAGVHRGDADPDRLERRLRRAGGPAAAQPGWRRATPSKPEPRSAQSAGQAAKSRYPASANLRSLPPIVTNLASPGRTWIRLEAVLVVEGEQTPDGNGWSAQIAEDIVAFLRTVPLVQIQGASGFQHLREDLNDRVRVRSGGKVRDLVIQSMIIE